MVAESPANLECIVHRVVDIGEGLSRMVVGRVVAIHVSEEALDGTRIISDQLRAIGRMAGISYVTTAGVFEIERPA
jgi:flavin reductase (DIM6/NTAB) family NADH-FMN oxidoreductase RutF